MTLEQRITNYLVSGGLFNPEAMEHEKVRDLLIDCREALVEKRGGEGRLDALAAKWEREFEQAQFGVWGTATIPLADKKKCAEELRAALATSRAEGLATPEWDGGWSQRTPEERAEIEKLWQVEQDNPPLIGNRARAAASQPSAEHAPAPQPGPLRRMREAVECVRHEGNDSGECWLDCRRCRLEKELAALAATNAQLRSALERLVSKWEKQAQEYRQRQMFDFAQEAGSYADELKAVLDTHIAADSKLNSPHMGTEFHVSGEPLTDSETQWLNRSAALRPTEERK